MDQIKLLVLIIAFPFSLIAQNNQAINNQTISANLDSLFQYCFENQLFNGTVLIFKKDQILHKKSYGQSNNHTNVSISGNTPFLLASISKQFTAIGIVLLHSKGKLKYDDYVQTYLPDFPYSEITIRHLLNHTSGLPEYTNLLNPQVEKLNLQYEKTGTIITNEKIAAMITSNRPPLSFSSGTNFDYNNTGYLYLALIIESISKKKYSQFLSQYIFTPLNMDDSWVTDINNSPRKKRAIGFETNYITNEISENESPPFLKVYGDGGIYSSANDLKKWYIALDTEQLLEKIELAEAYESPIINNKKAPYGFGWFVRELPFNGHKMLTHSGQFVGFTNSIFRDIEGQVTSIILSNNSHNYNSEINKSVVSILYNMPYKKPKLTAEIALGNLLYSKGIQHAKEFYKLNTENEYYNFSEKTVNQLGYGFIELKQFNMAIDVFKWNVELHPKSSNVYDSLGEAYLLNDNKQEALKNYQKAFELDNSNSNAQYIISKLKSE